MNEKKDFFVSYTAVDEHQATWIAGILEKSGYTTIIQAWDFIAGENFIENMDNALRNSKRLIAVLSEDYFRSVYARKEWTAAFAKYTEDERAIIPIKISDVKLEGLLATIIYIDLYKTEESKREEVLTNGIKGNKSRIIPIDSGILKGAMPFNNLPHSKNPYFTGRTQKLDLIYSNFQSGDLISLVQSIVGLGGVGKSSIALEYAYRYSKEYEIIWWVNAECSTTVLTDYEEFALKKKIISENAKADEIIETMKYWFNNNENWLFIYDNADSNDFNEWFEPYLPQNRKGHVLITTRSNFFPRSKSIDITVFTEDEAVKFLEGRTNKRYSDFSEDSSKELSKYLGYLPLALEQAAAYIVETPGVDFQEYINLFKKKIRNF